MAVNERLTEQAKAIQSFKYFCSKVHIQAKDYSVAPSTDNTIQDRQFNLLPFQNELIEQIEKGGQVICVKARQIGISQTVLCWLLHQVLYTPHFKALFLIPTEKRAKDALSKIKYMFKSLPRWLIPQGFEIKESGVVENQSIGSSLHMQTVTGDAGRSGTYSIVFVDEFEFIEPSLQFDLLTAIGAATQNQVLISTPKAPNSIFHNLVMRAELKKSLYKKTINDISEQFFHGKENASVWIDDLFKDKSKQEISREYLCDFANAVLTPVYEWNNAYLASDPKDGPVAISLDLGFIDPTAVLFARLSQGKLYIVDEIVRSEQNIWNIIGEIKDKKYNIIWACCDSSGKRVDQTSAESTHNVLQKNLGIKFWTSKLDKDEMIRQVQRSLFENSIYIDANRCPKLIECLKNHERDHNGKVKHDEYSHLDDALQYLVLNWKLHGLGYNGNSFHYVKRSSLGLI